MTRRTTVVADDEDLAVLTHEARVRGVSLGRLLGDIVAKEAKEPRRARRPRLGTFRANASIAQEVEREQPAARSFRL